MALLQFENLRYELGDRRRRVDVSGALPEGGVLSVRGPSGSGKSTLLRVLARLNQRLSGTLRFQSNSVDDIPAFVWRQRIQYVAQRPVAFDGSVMDNILLPYTLGVRRGQSLPSETAIRQAMATLYLDPDMLVQVCRTLSGGELARVALLRGIFARPSVLLLDEPTAALDGEARDALLGFLAQWVEEQPERGLALVSHLEDRPQFPNVVTMELHGRNQEEI